MAHLDIFIELIRRSGNDKVVSNQAANVAVVAVDDFDAVAAVVVVVDSTSYNYFQTNATANECF